MCPKNLSRDFMLCGSSSFSSGMIDSSNFNYIEIWCKFECFEIVVRWGYGGVETTDFAWNRSSMGLKRAMEAKETNPCKATIFSAFDFFHDFPTLEIWRTRTSSSIEGSMVIAARLSTSMKFFMHSFGYNGTSNSIKLVGVRFLFSHMSKDWYYSFRVPNFILKVSLTYEEQGIWLRLVSKREFERNWITS